MCIKSLKIKKFKFISCGSTVKLKGKKARATLIAMRVRFLKIIFTIVLGKHVFEKLLTFSIVTVEILKPWSFFFWMKYRLPYINVSYSSYKEHIYIFHIIRKFTFIATWTFICIKNYIKWSIIGKFHAINYNFYVTLMIIWYWKIMLCVCVCVWCNLLVTGIFLLLIFLFLFFSTYKINWINLLSLYLRTKKIFQLISIATLFKD